MIEVINLTKKYKEVAAVNNICFQVPEGETMGLIGTSGCGKTTTLKMLNRLIEPTSGQIVINGREVRKQKPEKLRQGIGYVIQNTGLFPHYTVKENVAVVPQLLKWKEKKIADRCSELLELVGLPAGEFGDRYPGELSGGQQQRVGLARALAADPPIVLLDEPFGALDEITRKQIQKEFKQLESLLHKTIVLVTHDIFEAVELCDRICLMDKGIAQQIGTPKELIFQPASDFVRRFFATNLFQLELKLICLKDLLPHLKPIETDSNFVKEYPDSTSLLDVLERVEESSVEQSFISINNEKGDRFLTTSEALFAAFYQTKESLHDGTFN